MHSYIVTRVDGTTFSIEASSFHISGDGLMFSRLVNDSDMFSPSYYTHWYKTSVIDNVVIDDSIQI
ncbi:MAG: hypothetical protein ACRC6V_18615 [Bacteroidales bacterium]